MWPKDAPAWLVIGGHCSWALIATSILLLLLPKRWAAKVWPLRMARREVVRTCKRVIHLSSQGPLFRVCAFCGRRCGGGRLASRPRVPDDFRARTMGHCDVSLTWKEARSLNPFHEVGFVVAWRRVSENGIEGEAVSWNEVPVPENEAADSIKNRDGSQWRSSLVSLPADTSLAARVCAVNRKGRSEWSSEVRVRTMAKPNDGGGGTGPLESTAASATYRWTQTREDVGLRVPIADDVRAKDLRVKCTGSKLEIRYAPTGGPEGGQLWLAGNLNEKVVSDEVDWELETDPEGRHLGVQMRKVQSMHKWPCLLEGHPMIDVRVLRFFTKDAGFDFYE